jgi:hypothetical protein
MRKLGPSCVFAPLLWMALHTMTANAGPRSMGCQVGKSDGVGLKNNQTMIENETGKVIPEGTVIDVVVQVRNLAGPKLAIKTRFPTFRAMAASDKLSIGDTPPNAIGCTASVSLIQPKKTITNKPPPKLSR